MPVSPTPFLKKYLYYGIMICLMLLIIELISRAYYYQRLSKEPLAAVQLLKDLKNRIRTISTPDTSGKRIRHNEALVRPGSSQAEDDQIAGETLQANQAVYEPWVQFAFRDIRSRYVNVSDHIRRSVPEWSDSLAKNGRTIYFLGGSTMYGYNVADAETIPSYFARAYQEKNPHGPPVHVVNLGMPYYFSYQELLLLLDRIFRGQKPDMVVMLDGLNDCLQANTAYWRTPVFTPGINRGIDDPYAADDKEPDYYKLPAGMSSDSACTIIYQHYLDNIRHAREITTLYNIPLYCFWQPVPYYNYPHGIHDPIAARSCPDDRFGLIYPMVRKKSGELNYLFYLGDMLQEEKGLPFVDQVHYSPYFNRVLAEKILETLRF